MPAPTAAAEPLGLVRALSLSRSLSLTRTLSPAERSLSLPKGSSTSSGVPAAEQNEGTR